MNVRNTIADDRRNHFQTHTGSALTAAVSLLLMAIIAGIAFGYFHGKIVVYGDAAATANLIKQHSSLVIIEVILWWVVFLLDIVVSFSLFYFYKSIHPMLSLITMVLRLVYTAVLGISISILSTVIFSTEHALSRIMLFERVWSIGLIVFGIHLCTLGIMAVKNKITPKLVSWPIVIGGACYIVVHALQSMGEELSNIASLIESYVMLPMALSEVVLLFWLLISAIKYRRKNASCV